jgi:DNA-binding CsgD family transcriptional regulator/tetratricopeptide (TPR) repeat protein
MAAISELRKLKHIRGPQQQAVPLVGRAFLLESLCSNQRSAGILFGEPGIGKSRLLREARARLEAVGAAVYHVSCLPSGQGQPLECFIEAARLLCRRGRISRAMLRAIVEAGERDRLASIRDVLEIALQNGPLVVQIDDLHWADAASLEALHFLVDRLQDLPIHWHAASRLGNHDVDKTANDLERAELTTRFDVDGLAPEHLYELASHLAPEARLDEAGASRLHALTGGNPLYAELVLHNRSLEGGDVAPDLRRALAERFQVLSEGALNVAGWLAANVEPLPLERIARLAGLSVGTIKALASTLIEARVVRRSPGGLAFRHTLLRDARYEMMSEQERVARHTALAAQSDDDRVRARHLESAARFEEAAALNIRIGWQCLDRDAPREALNAFVCARDLSPGEGEKWEAQGGAAIALYALGRREEAALAMAVFDAEADGRSAKVRALVHGRYAETIWFDAQDDTTAVALLEKAIAEARSADSGLLPRLLSALGSACERRGELERARTVLEEGLSRRGSVPPARETLRLQAWLGVVVGRLKSPREGIAILEKVVEQAAALRLDNEVAQTCTKLCFLCDLVGDTEAYERWCRRGLEVVGPVPRAITALLQSNLASVSSDGGRLREALGLNISASKMLDRGNVVYLCRSLCAQAFLNAFLGDFESAGASLREAASLEPPPTWRRAIAYTAGSVSEIQENFEAAHASYEEALEGRHGGDELEAHEIRALAGLVRTSYRLDLPEEGLAALERLRLVKARGWGVADPLFAEAEAWQKRFDGNLAVGCARLLGAADARQHPYWRAYLRLEAGLALINRQFIVGAINEFESMEAHSAADRGRAAARSLGLRPGRKSPPKNFLTPRETAVAHLIARGKTNGDIAKGLHVSRRTIELHVSTILSKTGLRSRIEIATKIAAGEFPAVF